MAEQDLHVDEEGKVIAAPVEAPPIIDDEDDAQDASPSAEAAGDEPHEDDTPDVDPEREAIRQRRREERRSKKEAQREREETLRRELGSRDAVINQLTERLSVIERKAQGMETSAIDQHMKQAQDAYGYYKNQIAVASAAGDHASIADATEKMILARDRFNQLDNVKKAYVQKQNQPAPLDPRLTQLAQGWLEKNNWYDPDGRDQDSRVASNIDKDMAGEGWNPTTEEYWKELDSRLKKYLPHRYRNGNNVSSNVSRPRTPVAGSGRESAGGNSGGTYKLSAERVSALKEAGVEVGTPEFAKHVKAYRDFDKQQSAAQ